MSILRGNDSDIICNLKMVDERKFIQETKHGNEILKYFRTRNTKETNYLINAASIVAENMDADVKIKKYNGRDKRKDMLAKDIFVLDKKNSEALQNKQNTGYIRGMILNEKARK